MHIHLCFMDFIFIFVACRSEENAENGGKFVPASRCEFENNRAAIVGHLFSQSLNIGTLSWRECRTLQPLNIVILHFPHKTRIFINHYSRPNADVQKHRFP